MIGLRKLSVFLCAGVCFLFSLQTPAAAQVFDCSRGNHDGVLIAETWQDNGMNGTLTYRCRLCKEKYQTAITAARHTWGEWVVGRPADCTTAGTKYRDCNFGTIHREYAEIPPTGHTYQSETTVQASCEGKGIEHFGCVNCTDFYEEEIPETGHAYGEWAIDTEPGPGREGARSRTCERCSAVVSEIIPAGAKPVSKPPPVVTPLKKQPLFNRLDLALIAFDFSFVAVMILSLLSSFYLIRWDANKRKEVRKRLLAEKLERLARGNDGFT